MPFAQYNLLPELLNGIKAMGFKSFTPIQVQAVPPALEGRDVLGSAMTGSGKTVAFVLPLLQRLLKDRQPGVRALVLVPTRELAAQVETATRDLARFSEVKCALIIGGASFHNQAQALRQGAQIVVATPGRLLDHYQRRTLRLDGVRVSVLDEADRMLDMGFMPDIRRIMNSLPRERQTMMFSATIPPEIQRAVNEFMRDPVRIQIDPPAAPASGITQMLYPVLADQKRELLLTIMRNTKITSAVVFTRTKSRADQVARFLETHGIPVAVLHSNKTQAERDRAMQGFRGQKQQILVATDIAARGLDVRHISHVVNFDVPLHPEDYVHRIGRTGRVFAVGDAITLMALDEERFVTAIESFIGATIPRCAFPDFPYRVPPHLTPYKPPITHHFRLRRRIARSSGMRFRRR
ncbi:MAG: DEAD/DEAH box helicase [Elusimicrobia bacterium]|nr:DEAD/DEAH box helicase [Elusimicrobiota bacterium]